MPESSYGKSGSDASGGECRRRCFFQLRPLTTADAIQVVRPDCGTFRPLKMAWPSEFVKTVRCRSGVPGRNLDRHGDIGRVDNHTGRAVELHHNVAHRRVDGGVGGLCRETDALTVAALDVIVKDLSM